MIYVEIDKRAGDYRTSVNGGLSFAELVGTGTSIGGAAGTVIPIPGIGSAIGAGTGAIVAGVGSLFGLGSGTDDVRDVLRGILTTAFGTVMPGKVEMIGSARDVPRLSGQYLRSDIEAMLLEIKQRTLAQLEPGSDAYGDLSRAFNSLAFNDRDTAGGYLVLGFDEAPRGSLAPTYGESSEQRIGGNAGSLPGGNIPAAGNVYDAGKLAGVSPVVLGIGIVALIVLFR